MYLFSTLFAETLGGFGQILGVGQGAFCHPKSCRTEEFFVSLFLWTVCAPALVLYSYAETLILDVMVIVFGYVDLGEVF